MASQASTRIGEMVGGKYRISRLLAEGGMGVVYEAQHEIVKRRFAVKFLRPDYAHRREFLGRFHREAEAAGALESDHIASAVDFGIAADGSPFIVMEYLVGEDLTSLLEREGRLPLERAADLCVQACHGAEAAHVAGIVHRDLKPKNLFICRREDGTDLLKILDFGIAKLVPMRYDHATTDAGTVMGTPAYMSPEHARGERTLDPRSDVYALGTILFEMLSGQLPHPGDSPNAILHHISTRTPVSIAVAAPGLPGALVGTVDRALATDPDARPQSAKALALELVPFAKRRVWPDLHGGKPINSQAGEEKEPSADSTLAKVAVADAGRARSWRRGALLATAAVLLAGVAAATITSHKTRTAPKPMIAPQPTRTEAFSADARAALRPAMANALAPPLPDAAPPWVAPSGLDRQTSVKPSTAKRLHADGRPSERPNGRPHKRPNETSSQRAPAEQTPTPRPTELSMPLPAIDRGNPYAKP